MRNTPSQPPEGWYGDVSQPGSERYWDGSNWTDQTRPLAPPPMPEKERVFGRSEADKAKDSRAAKAIGLAFFAIVAISAVSTSMSKPVTAPTTGTAPDTGSTELASDAEIPDQLPFEDSTTTTTTTTTIVLSPLEAFEAQLADESDRVVEVYFDEEIGFLRAEIFMDVLGFWVDTEVYGQITDVLELVSAADLEVENFDLAIHMEFTDQLGNSDEEPALRASWTGETISSINFPNFLRENVLPIGELTYIHPALASELGL